jgi:hypothetical protein
MTARHEAVPSRLPAPMQLAEVGAAHAYLLVALLILVALILTSLPVESDDDQWLRVGSITAVIGFSVWLRYRLLLPAALILALLPPTTRMFLHEDRSAGWILALELGGFVVLAAGSRFLYSASSALRRRRGSVAENESPTSDAVARHSGGQSPGRPRFESAVPVSPSRLSALVIRRADANSLLHRLRVLDAEILRTADLLRSAPYRR